MENMWQGSFHKQQDFSILPSAVFTSIYRNPDYTIRPKINLSVYSDKFKAFTVSAVSPPLKYSRGPAGRVEWFTSPPHRNDSHKARLSVSANFALKKILWTFLVFLTNYMVCILEAWQKCWMNSLPPKHLQGELLVLFLSILLYVLFFFQCLIIDCV